MVADADRSGVEVERCAESVAKIQGGEDAAVAPEDVKAGKRVLTVCKNWGKCHSVVAE